MPSNPTLVIDDTFGIWRDKVNITIGEVNTHVAAGAAAHPAVTTSVAGFMTAADKTKLNGIATSANNYTHPATHPPSIIVQDATNRFVTDTEKTAWNAKAETTVVTTSANGLMIAADKVKLNGIATSANNYVHPTTDGSLHVPATSTTNNGKVLKAGASAGVFAWGTLTKTDVGLANVDNTSDANKPISTATQTALNLKVSKDSDTGAAILPVGSDAQRPASPTNGLIRYNTSTSSFEGYAAGAWGSIGGGATGSLGETVFFENSQEINNSYTITTNKNAMTTGPVLVNDGVSITIPDGSRWVIL